MGSVELPYRMFGLADGNPGMANEVHVARKAFHLLRFEIERVLRDQDERIRPALDFHRSMNIAEPALTGADVIVRFVSFEMLVVVVELNVPLSNCF